MLLHRKFSKLLVEVLEDRTVPATLVSPTTMTFQDVDGDIASVVFSKPVLAGYNVNQVFQFDVGSVNGSNSQRQSLQQINLLAPFAADINGSDMTVKVVKKVPRGNGEVHVGSVFSLGQTFGKLDFQGDVGQLNLTNYAGTNKLAESISVNSIGRFDPYGNSLESLLIGPISKFLVRGDLAGAVVVDFNDQGDSQAVMGTMEIRGNVIGAFYTRGRINSVVIGGNLDGTALANPVGSFYGHGSFAAGGVGKFTLAGSVWGGKNGGGQLSLGGNGQDNLESVYIGGSIRGNGPLTGWVSVYGSYQSVTVQGSIIGGAEEFSGELFVSEAKNVYINGSIIGGAGPYSGTYNQQPPLSPQVTDVLENLQIKGSIVGGTGEHSGTVEVKNSIRRFVLTGSIQGGNGNSSGYVRLDANVSYFQAQSVLGGTGNGSGALSFTNLNLSPFASQRVVLFGSVKGGAGSGSGTVLTIGTTQLRVDGSVMGSTGVESGTVRLLTADLSADPSLLLASTLAIHGSVTGSIGDASGAISIEVPMDQLAVDGDIAGGQGIGSGTVQFEAHVKTLSIGGSLLGSKGFRSGSLISFYWQADTILVGKNIIGGAGDSSGGILLEGASDGSIISGQGNVKQITVGNQIVGGKGNQSGVIQAQSIEALYVGGSVLGGDGELAGGINVRKRLGTVRITRDLAGNYGYVYVGYYLGEGYLDSITIGGSIKNSAINSTGAIGSITVRGSIIGSASAPSFIVASGAYPPAGTPGHPYLIRSLTVGGDVNNTRILAGTVVYDPLELAQVGTVSIRGNWSNSVLVVGYGYGADNIAGTEDDVKVNADAPSSIDSVFIAGHILGNNSSVIQAGLISQLRLGQTTVALTPGEFNDDFLLSQLLRVWEKV